MNIIYRPPNSEKEFVDYFNFRWIHLRKPLGLERGSEQDELEKTSFHIAAFHKQKIIAVGRLQLENDNTGRVRYMAVNSQFRKQGIASRLLEELENIAKMNSVEVCWLYAREDVLTFYIKNYYEIKGKADSELAIKHQRMEKKLCQ